MSNQKKIFVPRFGLAALNASIQNDDPNEYIKLIKGLNDTDQFTYTPVCSTINISNNDNIKTITPGIKQDYTNTIHMYDHPPAAVYEEQYRMPTVIDLIDSSSGQKKNEEQVLAFHTKDLLGKVLLNGNINPLSYPNSISPDYELKKYFVRRGWCETDKRFVQVLPYVFFYKKTDHGPEFFTYQRGKGVGEQRLAGGCSIGIGGHINPIDFYSTIQRASTNDYDSEAKIHYRKGDVLLQDDFWSGVMNAVLREVDEEVHIRNGQGESIDLIDYIRQQMDPSEETKPHPLYSSQEWWLHQRTSFFLDYSASDVEKVHLGAFIGIEVPNDFDFTMREEELMTVGFKSLNELKDNITNHTLPSPLECWSISIIDAIYSTEAYLKEHNDGEQFELMASVPPADRWKIGTISGSYDPDHKFYTANMFVKV